MKHLFAISLIIAVLYAEKDYAGSYYEQYGYPDTLSAPENSEDASYEYDPLYQHEDFGHDFYDDDTVDLFYHTYMDESI